MKTSRYLLAALLLSIFAIMSWAHAGHDSDGDFDDEVGPLDGGDYEDGEYDDDGQYDEADEDGYYGGPDDSPFMGAGDDSLIDQDAMADFEAGLNTKMGSMGNPFGGPVNPDDYDMGGGDFGDLPDLEAALSEFSEMGGEGGPEARGEQEGQQESDHKRQKSPLPIGLNCADVTVPTMKKAKELVRDSVYVSPLGGFEATAAQARAFRLLTIFRVPPLSNASRVFSDLKEAELSALGISPAQYDAFWEAAELLTDHMGEVSLLHARASPCRSQRVAATLWLARHPFSQCADSHGARHAFMCSPQLLPPQLPLTFLSRSLSRPLTFIALHPPPQVFSEMEGPIDASADPVGGLLYDAILLDTAQHMKKAAAAGIPGAPAPADVPQHKPKFKKTTRRLLKKLRAFNTTSDYRGLPVRSDSAQLESLELLRTFTTLAGLVHAKLRGVPGLQVAPSGRPAVRGITCLFLASGRTPFEGAWEAPGATACMVLDSENPAELVAIGNVFCNSALAARAQISATLDRIAEGGEELEGLMKATLPGEHGDSESEDAATESVRSSLTGRVVALLREYDVEAFAEDGTQADAGEDAYNAEAPTEAQASEAAIVAAPSGEAAAEDDSVHGDEL